MRPSAAIAAAVLASACTSLLGIDGNYLAEHAPSPASGKDSTGAAPSTGAAGTTSFDSGPGDGGEGPGGSGGTRALDAGGGGKNGGASGNGGASTGGSNSGGMPANGGKIGSGGSGGIAAGGTGSGMNGSGGNSPDSGAAVCPTGTFRGNYTGIHHPSSGGTAVQAMIAGDVMLHLAASTAGHLSVTGTLVDPLDDPTGGIGASLSGTIDCVKGTGSATLSKGQVTTIVPTFFGPVDGSVDISVDDATSLSGDFNIHETINPTFAVGSGTWSAARTGN